MADINKSTCKSTLLQRYLIRSCIAFFAFSLEMLSLYYFKDSSGNLDITDGLTFAEYMREHGGWQFLLSSYSQKVAFLVLLSYPIIILVFWTRQLMFSIRSKIDYYALSNWIIFLNLASFFSLLIFYLPINNPSEFISNPMGAKSIFYKFFPIVWSIYTFTVLDIIFPLKLILQFIIKNKLLAILFITLSVLSINPSINPIHLGSVIEFWSKLLLKPTVLFATIIANSLGLATKAYNVIGESYPIFGTLQFNVVITPDCSGYEGITLAIAFLFMYCYLQRTTLDVRRSLLIVPFVVLAMFLLNAIRLVILIAIGHFYSPAMALNGFHSVGGWLNLMVVLILSMWILSTSKFNKNKSNQKNSFINELMDNFLLLPLIILIVISLLTKAFTANFQWFYPIPIGIVGIFLFYNRKIFNSIWCIPSIQSIFMGIIVFYLWIYLIPVDDFKSAEFFNELSLAPIGISLFWLLIRVIGATCTVPIAEEFAFRGFMLPRLENFLRNFFAKVELNISSRFILFTCCASSLIITSILFGILHSDIFAGSIAGFGYGIVYLQRKKLVDSVVAHGVTNALLAIYVINSGNWCYW